MFSLCHGLKVMKAFKVHLEVLHDDVPQNRVVWLDHDVQRCSFLSVGCTLAKVFKK